MSYLLTVSGSPHPQSKTSQFLTALQQFSDLPLQSCPNLAELPVFQPGLDRSPWPPAVIAYRRAWRDAAGVIIATPAYLHNIPGVLKNALDWLASSGEASQRRVLALTFTPAPPRGDRARQSLLWSLEALDARVVAEAPIYQSELDFGSGKFVSATGELLREALRLLT